MGVAAMVDGADGVLTAFFSSHSAVALSAVALSSVPFSCGPTSPM